MGNDKVTNLSYFKYVTIGFTLVLFSVLDQVLVEEDSDEKPSFGPSTPVPLAL